jgi:hypothetical protein
MEYLRTHYLRNNSVLQHRRGWVTYAAEVFTVVDTCKELYLCIGAGQCTEPFRWRMSLCSSSVMCYACGTLIMAPMWIKPSSQPVRIFVVFWLLYCIVVSVAYQVGTDHGLLMTWDQFVSYQIVIGRIKFYHIVKSWHKSIPHNMSFLIHVCHFITVCLVAVRDPLMGWTCGPEAGN